MISKSFKRLLSIPRVIKSNNIPTPSFFKNEECKRKDGYKNPIKNEMTMICTQLTLEGKLQSIGGRFLKSNICELHGLEYRDLRKLDGTLRNQLPAILVRPSAILINLSNFKAIIKSDLVIFFDSIDHQERISQRMFILDLQQRLKRNGLDEEDLDSGLPFELRVMEAIFLQVCNGLQKEYDEIAPAIEANLQALEGRIHWEKLKILLESKKKINHFKNRVDNIRSSIADVLNSDVDMASMYLTAKANNLPRHVSAHEEVELLLENYLKMVDEISNGLEELQNNIESTEDIVNIGLVGQRNQLLLFELKLTMGTFAAAVGSFGASVFGMNLRSQFESHPSAFYITALTLSAICVGVYVKTCRRMFNVIKSK